MDTENQEANAQDELEIAIKNNISVGQTFKSMSAVYRTIGFELLGIGDLNGGKQCDAAKAMVEQYARFELVEPNKHNVRCVEIFESPHYIEKTDDRGKGGYYIDRLVPLLLLFLRLLEEEALITSVKKLAIALGIVKKNFEHLPQDEPYIERLGNIPGISLYAIKQFYHRCRSELEPKIIGALDRLKKEGILEYERRFYLKKLDGNNRLANDEEFLRIKEVEKSFVQEMGAKNKRTIYLRNQGEEFECRVVEHLNEEYKMHLEKYLPVLDISFVRRKVNAYLLVNSPYNLDKFKKMETEVRKRLAEAIRKKTRSDYARTNKRLDIRQNELFSQLKEVENIEEFYSNEELKEKSLQMARQWAKEKKVFYFWPSYLETQDKIIRMFVG